MKPPVEPTTVAPVEPTVSPIDPTTEAEPTVQPTTKGPLETRDSIGGMDDGDGDDIEDLTDKRP